MEDRIATVRGSIYRSTRILPGDLLLVSLRDFEKIKPGSKQHCDILLKYSSNEVAQLKRQGVYYKGTTNVFSVSLDKDGNFKEKNTDSVQFDNNYKIPEMIEDVAEEQEDSDDDYGPRKITDHIVKDIDDMSDYEDEDESSETNEESNNQN
jgi:hypothetical protein